jgi:mono/diheme cytochrome c family protein
MYADCLATDAPGPVRVGVFTVEQAQRGELIYKTECATCHAADMRGGPAARGLRGVTFQYLWTGRTVADLFNAMRQKMPPGQPGSLGEQAYLDVLAAILQRNGFPTGETEIEADEEVLNSMVIGWERPD